MIETSPTIHASCVVIGTVGLLVRGASGAGKSSLCDHLIEAALRRGHHAGWVSDDRTVLLDDGGRVVARAAKGLEERFEVRGIGILRAPFERRAAIDMIIDILPLEDLDRLPEDAQMSQLLNGVVLPRVPVLLNSPEEALRRIRWVLRRVFPQRPDYF
ncbi:hypothetical protein GCM10011316_19330 [Roseibium aquae]|uniref:HPr kinase/phosphorylase C-terminal domain-containing protein n=1 Tax=Roseibium aquae TaxID=1323746 RepID=A0A916TIY9_9HYPH|nr:aldolase [Roseibium aquae]GGB47359.1 hypothetical protein GCM10011316_19330 [Roseibium aquae]